MGQKQRDEVKGERERGREGDGRIEKVEGEIKGSRETNAAT